MTEFQPLQPIIFTYHSMALVAATGGALGWVRSRSRISLVAGLGVGAMFLAAARLTAQSGNTSLGLYLGTATSSLLAWRMALRALKAQRSALIPATVALLSTASAVYSIVECNKRGFL